MLARALALHLDATVGGVDYRPTTAGGNTFTAVMPSEPDQAIAIMPSGGFATGEAGPHDEPTVQIVVRGPEENAAASWDLAQAIYGELQCLDDTRLAVGTVDETWVSGCTAMQSAPVPLGRDENRRVSWSLNFHLHIDNPTTHRPAYTA